MKSLTHKNKIKSLALFGMAAVLLVSATIALGQGGGDGQDIASIADNIKNSYSSLGELLIGTAYLAGIGFAIAGVFKFKQHRDNPTQVPLGTPLALLGVGIVLVFLPSLFGPSGQTIFGGQQTAGGFKGKQGAGGIPGGEE